MDPTFNATSWQHWALIISLMVFVCIGFSEAAAEDRRIRRLRDQKARERDARLGKPGTQHPDLSRQAIDRNLPPPNRRRPEVEYRPEALPYAPAYGSEPYGSYAHPASATSAPFPDSIGSPFPATPSAKPTPGAKPAKTKAKSTKGKTAKAKATQAPYAPIDDIPSTPTEIVYDTTPISRSAQAYPPAETSPVSMPPRRSSPSNGPPSSPFLDIPKDRWPL